jgi:hypothetical protein
MPIEFGSFSLALVGAMVGGFVGHYLTKSRNAESRFNEAAAKFRDAFRGELLLLNTALTEGYKDPCELLKAGFEKHRIAVFDFRLFLKGKQRKNFDQAWRNYYGYDDDPNVELEFLAKYSGQGCSIERGKEASFHGYCEIGVRRPSCIG